MPRKHSKIDFALYACRRIKRY